MFEKAADFNGEGLRYRGNDFFDDNNKDNRLDCSSPPE